MQEIAIQLCEYMADLGWHAVISDGEIVEFVEEFAS